MAKTLADMSLVRNATPLSGLGAGTQTLINNIVNDSNDSDINSGAGAANAQKFFNHSYDKDPATNGGALGLHVSVDIYYIPSTAREYDSYDVVDKNDGYWSGRRRLAVRNENDKWSFYTTSHPKESPGLRTNVYGNFIPVNPAK